MPTLQAPLHQRSIRYEKRVGPQRMALLAQLGIENVEDALYYPPRRYEDRSRLVPIGSLQSGEVVTVRGTVLARGARRARRGLSIVEASFGDGSGVIRGLWFHQPYLARQLAVGDEYVLYGRVEGRSRLQLVHPEMERVEGTEDDASVHMGRIVPIYPLTAHLGQRWFRCLIAGLLERYGADVADPLPVSMLEAHGFPALPAALRQLHFPEIIDAIELAQQRLAFEELLLLQLILAQRRARAASVAKPQRYRLEGPLTEALRRTLPFTLTAGQERVLEELYADLGHTSPMARLLQGDVGCGKTIVLVFLMAAAVQSGYQVALMAPTELLAEQHVRVIGSYLGPMGVSVGLLSQGVPPPERAERLAQMASGTLSIAVGTHALIQRDVTFKRLALVIIDEQHKFGVAQRIALARKAAQPDVVVLTATPIPRTLALSLYGDLSCSTITELPPGRPPVETLWMKASQRRELYALIRDQLARGRQGYVVYPLVEEDAAAPLKAARQMAKQLQAEIFPDVKVGLLHGQMKPAQKERVMRGFVDGTLQLLVSTVIVEVGLDVPNATVMIIEHAERFGLAQLHQLRGRIGRTHLPDEGCPPRCIVVCDSTENSVRQRLQAFVGTTDGFVLAEQDLHFRGPGQLLGKRQAGWLRLRIADLTRDRRLLETAREEAMALIARHPDLADPSLAVLRERLERFRHHPT